MPENYISIDKIKEYDFIIFIVVSLWRRDDYFFTSGWLRMI
jgi:hypothetical protein